MGIGLPAAAQDEEPYAKSSEATILPWDDSLVSREGLVLVDVVPSSKGCRLGLREPHDPAILPSNNDYDEIAAYQDFDNYDQVYGQRARSFRVDVRTFIMDGC